MAVARIAQDAGERDAGRALLRELLRSATGVPAADWRLDTPAGAAPVASAAGRVLHASLSHRLGWVAAAVSDRRVGVDVECPRPARSPVDERAALMLSPAERPAWHALPAAAREDALLLRWTAKEAWFKACPPGGAPWDFRQVAAFDVAPADANVRGWATADWRLALCSVDAAALAGVDADALAGAAPSFLRVERAPS